MIRGVRCLAVLALVCALPACRRQPTPPVTPADRVTDAERIAHEAVLNERTRTAAALPERTVGVPPMNVTVSDTAAAPLAYGLADILMTDLARSQQLEVVDRLRLDAMLRELRLVDAGRVDPTTAPRVGRLVGARRLVLGTLSRRPNGDLQIDARIADVATSEVRLGVSASARLVDILDAEKALAFRLFDQLGVRLTPAERAAVEQRPTKDIAALIAYGRAVRYEVERRYDMASREYERALQLDPQFALARTRLANVQALRGPPQSQTSAGSRARRGTRLAGAAGAAAERVNRPLVSLTGPVRLADAADPKFPGQSATFILIISALP